MATGTAARALTKAVHTNAANIATGLTSAGAQSVEAAADNTNMRSQ
jgi:hypothetical protein